jgi:hypothetical protein
MGMVAETKFIVLSSASFCYILNSSFYSESRNSSELNCEAKAKTRPNLCRTSVQEVAVGKLCAKRNFFNRSFVKNPQVLQCFQERSSLELLQFVWNIPIPQVFPGCARPSHLICAKPRTYLTPPLLLCVITSIRATAHGF